MKIIETKIQQRFADIDMFRHVNNIHQQAYLDLGKTDYYRTVLSLDALVDSPTLVIASVKSDFIDQVRYGADVVVRSWVERIGTKSITLRQQIVTRENAPAPAETICTESESVLVCFDMAAQAAVEIPAAWREGIEDKRGA
jgi:acyl-CoA thioester hydrolase